MTDTIYTQKKKYSKILKDFFHFETKNKPTAFILLKNTEHIDFLLDGLEVLSCDFIIQTEKQLKEKINVAYTKNINKDLLLWVDFIILDNETSNLQDYFSSGITPIIPSNNHLWNILKEFDPLTSEGNAYIYKENNQWSLYYSVIRYLENYKFPYDNRNLIKNVINL